MSPKKTQEEVKIVYLTTIPFTIWAFLSGHIEYMRSRGFSVIGVSSPDEMLKEVSDRNKIPVYGIPMSRRISPFSDLISLFRLFRLFRTIKPEIVNMSTPKASLLGAIAAAFSRVPIRIFLVRGLITENATGLRRFLFLVIERLTSLLCNRKIFVSPSLLEYARSEKIVSKGGGIVLGFGMSNGIDTSRFDPEDDEIKKRAQEIKKELNISKKGNEIILGFVGRIADDKGILELVTIWSRLKDRFPDLYLIIVGPNEIKKISHTRIFEKFKSDPRVFITGFVKDTAPYYKLIDILIFPSHGTEGFPNAPMEAAAMQVPTIATSVIGCVDAIVDKKMGILTEPGDIDAMTDAVSMLIRDPEMRTRLGEEGRRRCIKDFRPELIWEATYREYLRLLDEKGLR
jgi:glycosyltransferase involved in cell wall biosynthesis